MRTAITIGISDKGKAEIISHPSVSIHDQRRAFNELGGKKDKFSEVQLWESGRGMVRRKRFSADEKGGVDFNAAHPVHEQQGAKKKGARKLADLSPTFGEKGGVNFAAAAPVAEQGKKSKSKKAKKAPKAKKTAAAKADKSPAAAPASDKSTADKESDSGPAL